MSILYPNVPIAAGVPPVLRDTAALVSGYESALTAAAGLDGIGGVWGVFARDGSAIAQPDSVVALGFVGEHRIGDYPIEGGDFQSYNKVRLPFLVRVAMAKGGSVADRLDFSIALETARNSLTLVDVVTPERVYVGVNVVRVSYDRTPDSGAGMLTAELTLEEVRQTATVQYTKAKEVPASTGTADTTMAATASTSAPRATTLTPSPFAKGATKAPAAATPINRGAVQSLAAATGSKAKLVATSGGVSTYEFSLK